MSQPQLLPPLLGGLVLGLTVFWNAVLNGRVIGVSGALHRATTQRDFSSLLFIGGLALGGATLGRTPLSPLVPTALASLPRGEVAAAAFLLGLGARLANGCTSGHALCGLSRLSRRSLHAVVVFMAVAIATASLLHGAGPADTIAPRASLPLQPRWQYGPAIAALLLPGALAAVTRLAWTVAARSVMARGSDMLFGLLFAAGLLQTGMADRARILAFLNVRSEQWDPFSLPLVFCGALPPAIVAFAFLKRDGAKPLLATQLQLPTSTAVDATLTGGAAAFGVGWGWLGLCPGPAVVNFGAYPGVAQSGIILAATACGLQFGRFFPNASK